MGRITCAASSRAAIWSKRFAKVTLTGRRSTRAATSQLSPTERIGSYRPRQDASERDWPPAGGQAGQPSEIVGYLSRSNIMEGYLKRLQDEVEQEPGWIPSVSRFMPPSEGARAASVNARLLARLDPVLRLIALGGPAGEVAELHLPPRQSLRARRAADDVKLSPPAILPTILLAVVGSSRMLLAAPGVTRPVWPTVRRGSLPPGRLRAGRLDGREGGAGCRAERRAFDRRDDAAERAHLGTAGLSIGDRIVIESTAFER